MPQMCLEFRHGAARCSEPLFLSSFSSKLETHPRATAASLFHTFQNSPEGVAT